MTLLIGTITFICSLTIIFTCQSFISPSDTFIETNTVKLEELRERRKEIAALEPIYCNTITAKNPTKRATISYKVVVI